MLEGGGVKNIALLGAVTVLAEAGYTFPRVAGTSGGAIIAAGVAAYQKAGRDLGGLLDVSLRVDKPRFLAWRRPGHVSGSVSGAVDLLRRGGLHSGTTSTSSSVPPWRTSITITASRPATFSAFG